MNINSKSAHEIIQTVNESILTSSGVIDSKITITAKEALDELSKRELTPFDKIELIALSHRITTLPQTQAVQPLTGTIDLIFKRTTNLAHDFLATANLTENTTKEVESLFLKYPNNKEEILQRASYLMNTSGTSLEETIAMLKNEQEKKMESLIESFKSKAKHRARPVNIQNSGITDQTALIEIAKIEATHGGLSFSSRIKNYGITDQQALIEIAKLAAAQSGAGVSLRIKNYGITDKKALMEIATIALQNSELHTLKNLNNFDLDQSTDEYKDLLKRGLLSCLEKNKGDFLNELSSLANSSSFLTDSQKNSSSQKNSTTPFFIGLQLLSNRILSENLWSEDDQKALLEKVAIYGNKPIAASLATILLKEGHSKEFKDAYDFLVRGNSKDVPIVHKILPSILPAKWISEIKKNNSLTAVEEKATLELLSFLNKSKSTFKDNASRLMQPYLQTVITLDEMDGLSASKKLQLLSSVCNSSEYIKGFSLIRSLCARKEIEALENLSLEDPINELKSALEVALIKDQFINLSGIENLVDVYLEKFENTRVPMALETYVTAIRSLGDEEVRKTLERFIRSVLLDTFNIERYDTSNSPHLKQIEEYDTENGTCVLEDWKALTFTDSVSPILESREEKTFSFEDFFRQKLGDGHGRKNSIEQFSDLSSFLVADREKREEILTVMEQKIKNMTADVKGTSKKGENNEKKQLLKMNQIQKTCAELIATPDLSKEKQITKLQNIAAQLPDDVALKKDLMGLVQDLRTPQNSSSTERVELCKDWEDLFLSGTEVAGSCQMVNGDAELNQCLLAYCLDGKNAMVAVKGTDGIILARSMLRLLWDKGKSKPTLFLDKLYPSPCHEARKEAIKMAATECAKKLGLELFTAGDAESSDPKEVIESLGSSCPYEYADGADGVIPNGIFTIRNAIKLT